MRSRSTYAILTAALLAFSIIPARLSRAQLLSPSQPDMDVDAKIRAEIVEGIAKRLNESYVFAETATRMGEDLRKRHDNHEYDKITSARTLVETLTGHLRDVSHDKHIRVIYSHETLPESMGGPDGEPTPEMRERMQSLMSRMNFGFEKVERLQGNVGYVDLRGFLPADLGGETAAAAMNFLANTDALIIDLRQNGGGDPAMVALISSYLFGPDPVHLNDLYFRPDNSTHQWWTLPFVPGKRFVGKDVYVLISKRTFSAAEEFTYNLKNLKRATIVGETTGGGAHPGGPQRINAHFALATAHLDALKKLAKTSKKSAAPSPLEQRRNREIQQAIETLEKELAQLKAKQCDKAQDDSK